MCVCVCVCVCVLGERGGVDVNWSIQVCQYPWAALHVLCDMEGSWGHSAGKGILKCILYTLENSVCGMCYLTELFFL